MIERGFQAAALAVYRTNLDQANITRGVVAERRDAYKWVAALSTGAFLFVGQLLPTAGLISFATNRWLLLAEAAFGLSVLGAAGYLLIVDRRTANWARAMYAYTVHATSKLQSMDGYVLVLRNALNKNDLSAANESFKDANAAKETLTEILAKPPEDIPHPGLLGAVCDFLCVSGFLLGVTLVGVELISRVAV